MTVFEPKYPFSGLYKNLRDTIKPYGMLEYGGSKELFKGQSRMFELKYYQPKNKFKKYLWIIFFIFKNDAENSLVKNASILHFKFMERGPRENKILEKPS